MSLDLTEDQLRRVRQGEPVTVRSPDFPDSLVLAPQHHLSSVYGLILEQIGDRPLSELSRKELNEEIDEALFMYAWLRAGRKAYADQVREDSAEDS